jgi:uncharacterized protein YmfQ (DUF2313 family)
MTTVDKQQVFIENSIEVNTESLANYLPGGELFRAKRIEGSTLRTLLRSISLELGRLEAKLQELADEYYIEDTVNLLEEWENAVGIPDDCFKTDNQTIEWRRKQVIAKLALMNVTTPQDFVDLAAFFDIRVQILSGHEFFEGFPFTFPMTFYNSAKEARFTMIVYFPDIPSPANTFPMTFPILFAVDPTDFIMCMFEKIKPAPVVLARRYQGILPPTDQIYLEDVFEPLLLEEDDGPYLLEDELY